MFNSGKTNNIFIKSEEGKLVWKVKTENADYDTCVSLDNGCGALYLANGRNPCQRS